MDIFNLLSEKHLSLQSMKKISGIFNDSYMLVFDDEKLVIKVPKNTIKFEYRQFSESLVLAFLEENHFKAPRNLSDREGYRVRSYTEGETLFDLMNRGTDITPFLKSISQNLANLHRLDYSKLSRYEAIANSHYLNDLTSFEKGNHEFYSTIYGHIFEKFRIPKEPYLDAYELTKSTPINKLVIGHNDLHPKNIIVNRDKQVTFIDWESSSICDPAHDIASHIERMDYTYEQEFNLIDQYLAHSEIRYPRALFIEQVNRYKRVERIRQFINQLIRFCISTNNYEIPESVINNTVGDIYKKYVKACEVWNIPTSLTEGGVLDTFKKSVNVF